MIAEQFSTAKIRNYLHRWTTWWPQNSEAWHYHEILHYFLAVCWDQRTAAVAAKLLFQGPTREVRSSSDGAMAFVAVSEKLGSQLAA